jgi:hypothetical protein
MDGDCVIGARGLVRGLEHPERQAVAGGAYLRVEVARRSDAHDVGAGGAPERRHADALAVKGENLEQCFGGGKRWVALRRCGGWFGAVNLAREANISICRTRYIFTHLRACRPRPRAKMAGFPARGRLTTAVGDALRHLKMLM